MDLKRRLSRWALGRPSVLVIDAPGTRPVRWEVEAELDRRGWTAACSPACADLVLVLGEPGPELTAAADLVWSQVPHPRHLARIVDGGGGVGNRLDEATTALVDAAGEQASVGGDPADWLEGNGDVAGLSMADTAEDRDGLELDALGVTLGPVLPAWPTGLVVRASMQGDVLTGVTTEWLDSEAPAMSGDEAPAPAVAADDLARFLEVAGWPVAARQARAVRGRRQDGGHLAQRVRRSRALAWSVRGIDGVLDRVYRWCDIVDGRDASPAGRVAHDDLAGLLDGAELAAARLIVASNDSETLRHGADGPRRHGAGHG